MRKLFLNKAKYQILVWQHKIKSLFNSNETKIFVIGRNKTGTTSLHREFEKRGYRVGNQRKGELLLNAYKKREFGKIVNFSKTAQVFQDVPFSYPETYKHLDKAYPGAKFILSIRDSPEQWYDSIVKFHSKIFGSGDLPSKEDLQNADYVYKGWIWEANRILYSTPENEPYSKKELIDSYIKHNEDVMEYFKDRDNLLVLNIAEDDAYQKFCDFLNISSNGQSKFPWENRTKSINIK